MRVGVAQTVPQTWAEVTEARNIYISSTGAKALSVSDLSGNYYMFYASQITYSNDGKAIASFMFPKI
jgi:hypothetical protein